MWRASFNGTLYPTPLDACKIGEAQARVAVKEANEPGSDWRHTPTNPTVTPIGLPLQSDYNCPFNLEKWFVGINRWITQEQRQEIVIFIPDSIAYYAVGEEGKFSCEKVGNPCDVVTGRKTERQTDYDDGWLSFTRYYDSGSSDPGTEIGAHWRHSFDTRMDSLPLLNSSNAVAWPLIVIDPPLLRSGNFGSQAMACTSGWQDIKTLHRGGALASATASMVNGVCQLSLAGTRVDTLDIRSNKGYIGRVLTPGGWGSITSPIHTVTTADGGFYTFEQTSPGVYAETSKYPVRLVLDGSQWLFYHTDNTIDRFSDGKLISRTFVDGRKLTLAYDATSGRLSTITDDTGRSLQLTYNGNGQVGTLTHPAGQISYGYGANYNLTTVTYEDTKTRQYHYEKAGFPNHLTGITDERNIRFATWDYDVKGKVSSSKHGTILNANLTTLTYNPSYTTVTDAAGGSRDYHLGVKGSFFVVTDITGDKCLDCPRNMMKERTYDTNGFLDEVTDWKGNITDYDFDGRGLEVQRIEAKGDPVDQRTITTEWEPVLRLPKKITEPERVIDFTYDNGRLLTRKVTPPGP